MGTVLSPNNNSYQNMLCYTEIDLKIKPLASEKKLEIPVVCINMIKKIPENGLQMTFKIQSENDELNYFIKNLSKMSIEDIESITQSTSPTNAQMQSAVWIISDNANYEELGALVTTENLLSRWQNIPAGTRVLDAHSVAVALVLLKECGINVESKRIWRDRFIVYENLDDGLSIKNPLKSLINRSY